MPIQEKDLGKYKRPAIYIEEIDNSLIEVPSQNVLINLVPGFSRKGPFNRPVFIDNTIDFERIFGTIDRQLENKGSFFHRTCLKMLENSPIWALNLLATVPDRDVLNYVSISTTPKYTNSSLDNQFQAPFERFFNRQDFWVRDDEAFLNVVNNPIEDTQRLLHLTNMGERKITTFIFKSTINGFDMTAREWYAGDDNVPTFIHPLSLMSDYMVTVLILSGDWTDYNTLSNDTTWSRYFNTKGLIIDNIQNFVNERGVNVLGSYDVSLIPNFRDLNNRDMYIKNVINNNTDRTSLFCTYNEDLILDSDDLTDLIDIIGNTVVGLDPDDDIESINFLSYHQDIKETEHYPLIKLDSPNNVFGNATFGSETHEWNNWTQNGFVFSVFDDTQFTATFNLSTAEYIINGSKFSQLSGLTSTVLNIQNVPIDKKRTDVIFLNSNGLNVMTGIETDFSNVSNPLRDITFDNNNTIILGTLKIENNNGTITSDYDIITNTAWETVDIITNDGTTGTQNWLNIEFVGTSGGTLQNNQYNRLRSQKVYNQLASLVSNRGVIINSSGTSKTQIIDPNIIGFTSTTNSIVQILLDNPTDYTSINTVLLYLQDNMFKLTNGFGGTTVAITTDDLNENNIIGRHSKLYLDFFNGLINTYDYIDDNGVKRTITMFTDENGDMTLSVDGILSDESNGLYITSDIGNWKQTVEIVDYIGDDINNIVAIKVDRDRYSQVRRGSYLTANFNVDVLNDRKLVRVVDVRNEQGTNLKILYTDGAVLIKSATDNLQDKENMYTTTYPTIYSYATTLKGISLDPFIIHQDSKPNGTETRLNTILNIIGKNTSLFKGLVNKNKIAWRYLIDSFGLGLTENSKQQYIDLCGKKLNCFGFINMPSAKDFKKSSNPSFVTDDGSLSTDYMKDGANLELNPDFLYSFGTGQGRSTTGYFFPYVRVVANGVSKFVPPAAFAASAYMRKFTTTVAGVTPWTIVAGVSSGRVPDISGTEIDFSEDDLDNFSEMGVNPITFIRNVGFIINDENTAQVFPVSSLSYIHSREVLIELENELYDMLLRYQWKFNTPSIRSEIKYRADIICQRFVDSDGLFAYRNIIDETNNTPLIIDLQGGVLDTHVEIVKGMGWIVNNITIERTGSINSTGFQI